MQIHTRDLGRVLRALRAIEAGIVGVNEGIISTAEAPFGGVKQSSIGPKAHATESKNTWKSNMFASVVS